MANDPLKPSAALLAMLGSIAVHADEFLSPGGHRFDQVALRQLLQDPAVREWIAAMDEMGMVPRKRGSASEEREI